MSEYLMSVIGGALLAGVVVNLLPEGGGEGMKKYVKLLAALCVLTILISPAVSLLESLGTLARGGFEGLISDNRTDFEGEYRGYMLEVGKENIERGVAALLFDKYGIPEGECRVKAEVREGDEGLELIRINITLSGRSALRDPYAIEGYLSGLLDCECRVN